MASSTQEIPATMKEENDAESFEGAEQINVPEEGIVLDAGREVRAKLYMGQVGLPENFAEGRD